MFSLLSLSNAVSASSKRVREGEFVVRNYNKRTYKLYIPTGYRPEEPVPLFLLLHGCNQGPDNFARDTEMNEYAERANFIVVYPEQTRANHRIRCWNWYKPENQVRGRGEPRDLAGIVNQVKQDFAIDNRRVYVAGISAGATMATILGVTYPDLFAAIGICAGLQYKATTNLVKGVFAMLRGGPDPRVQATLAFEAMGNHKRIMPVIVFHGTADTTVAPINADQVIAQWGRTNQLVAGEDPLTVADFSPTEVIQRSVPNGRSYTEYVYCDQTSEVLMKKYLIDGMKHVWPGGPKTGSYTDPTGPKASQLLVDFFLEHPMKTLPEPEPIIVPTGASFVLAKPQASVAKPPLLSRLLQRVSKAVRGLVARISGDRKGKKRP